MRSVKIEVDLNALKSNLDLARNLAKGSHSNVFAVIKSNAYGHGAVACAKALESSADGFAVVDTSEALQLRYAGINSTIMVIQGAQNDDTLLESVAKDIQLSVHSAYQVDAINRLSKQFVKPLAVWIKVDSGMGRLGFRLEEFDTVFKQLRAMSGVKVVGCFSHLSCADESEKSYTTQQLDAFSSASAGKGIACSLANSAATLAHPATHLDWVRPGIMLYGANPLWPQPVKNLKPVMTVKAPLIAVRKMKNGESIGYGNRYRCASAMQVGVVAIGYGDGYPRHMQAGASVMFAGTRCSLLGRVSMDSIVIDLAGVSTPNIGQMAVIWGDSLPVEEIADKAGTISYELLCQIRGDITYY